MWNKINTLPWSNATVASVLNLPSLTLLLCIAAVLHGCTQPPSTEVSDDTKDAPAVATPARVEADEPAADEAVPEADEAMAATEDVSAPTIDISGLAMKVDPVCKMSLEEYPPVTTATYKGKDYGFCSDFCKRKFEENPDKLLARFNTVEQDATPSE